MSTSLIPDPMQLWRDALTRLEGEVNAAATGGLKSQEVMRALHQFNSVSLGMQQMFEKAIDAYLRRANLPSRKEVVELAESLRRIEDKLDRLLPGDGASGAARPARTRRPPVEEGASPAASATSAAAAAVPAPAAKKQAPRRSRTPPPARKRSAS